MGSGRREQSPQDIITLASFQPIAVNNIESGLCRHIVVCGWHSVAPFTEFSPWVEIKENLEKFWMFPMLGFEFYSFGNEDMKGPMGLIQ